MKANKTNEMLEQYSAPMCKVVKTTISRAIMAVSGPFNVDDLEEKNWDE